jgi:hypothetical protein
MTVKSGFAIASNHGLLTMSEKISRRDFLSKKLLEKIFQGPGPEPLSPEARRQESLRHYFRSPLHSYPLLQEMPWDLLLAEAQARGIPTAGRSKNAIARDLFIKVDQG